MTVKQFISHTGYKQQTVYLYLQRGLIKSSKKNNHYIIDDEEANKWKQRKQAWDILKK